MLANLDLALQSGLMVRGFRSGGGLRVIRVEDPKSKELKGYGEHPNVEEALAYADEDFEAGHREYGEVYGEDKLHPHYLTGSSSPTGKLDSVLLRGQKFRAELNDGQVVFNVIG